MKLSDHETYGANHMADLYRDFWEVLLPLQSYCIRDILNSSRLAQMNNTRCSYQDRTDYVIIIIKLYQSYGMICVLLVYTLDLSDFFLSQNSCHVLFTNWYPLGGSITGLPFYYINNSQGRPKEENNIWLRQEPCKCLVAWDYVKCFYLFVRFMCVCTFLFWGFYIVLKKAFHLYSLHVSPM